MRKLSPSNPSSTFYWKDYENDEGLRVSSLAAQGLWMRLLCVAAKADPYGYVLINGCEIGVTGVARLGSVTETEAATLLDELERNGVFSRDRKGRIYSRRMVKESAVRKKAVENGKKGGNPALSASHGKQTEKDRSVNLQDNGGGPPLYPYPYPIEPNGSKEEEPNGSSKKSARRKPELPLPENWTPSDRNIADAEARNFSQQEIEHEADRFSNFHRSKDSRFRDWDAAWRTWLGNARKFAPRGMAGGSQPGGRGPGGSLASIAAQRRAGGLV